MKRLGLAGVALLALGLLLLPSAAMAQECDAYPACSQNGQVSSSVVAPGGRVTFSYSGGEGIPGSGFVVDFLSAPRRIASGTFDSFGNFSITVTIPSDATAGQHFLRAVGTHRGGGQLTVSAALTVSGALIPTGSNPLPIALVGVGAITVGGTFVGLRRRRASA